jgi:hypothetical protein
MLEKAAGSLFALPSVRCAAGQPSSNLLHGYPFPRSRPRRRAAKEGMIGNAMLNLRYVVVSEESQWQIVRGGRRFPETYPSKRQAVRSAIALAERDGLAGRRAEVMVRHENGLFITERVFGENVGAQRDAELLLLSSR